MTDTIVIFVFSLFIMMVGLSFSRTGRNLKSFFAGGESVPWFIGGLSLFMSFFSAGTFVAWGSIAYSHGWVAITIQWTMCIGGLVTGLLLAPRWKRTGNLTAAEFIKERLGIKVQKCYIFIFTLVSLFIKGSVLYSVAILVSTSLGYPLMPVTIILGILMIAYTAVGGLWAVMVTDILQFVILTAAVIIVIPLIFDQAGGLQQVLQKVPDGFFNVVNGEFTWGFIIAYALYHIFYIGGNWTFVQRYTSVVSTKAASKVAFLFAALYILSPVLWMIPPMVYRTINPTLTGLHTEDAYILLCKQILPAGLLGLMLTGMYFSTSASANTSLNVVSAVFTNDIYKTSVNPGASDKKLMFVARASSWFFGICMILIALIVPYIGGIVEFTISLGAITGAPLLLPPIWALFSRKLTGRETMLITIISLLVNLIFKALTPIAFGFSLSRANEMVLGVALPLLLLVVNEFILKRKQSVSKEYIDYLSAKDKKKSSVIELDPKEALAIKNQNRFGLKMISFSLIFISILLYILAAMSDVAKSIIVVIASLIFLSALIPFYALKRKG